LKVGILDYGVGNLASVYRALEHLATAPIAVSRAVDIHKVDKLILPGVGSFTDCKLILDQGGWSDELREAVLVNKKPLLGICLGMQLLAGLGEEGAYDWNFTKGLGLIPGKVLNLLSLGCDKRTPHVGWNTVYLKNQNSLFKNISTATDFYFVHSYAFVPDDEQMIIAEVNHGVTFAAAVAHDQVWGTQFHPEKSSKAGLQILKNFVSNSLC